MLEVGQLAPGFELPDQLGAILSLSDFLDKKAVVLYFYPKDDTTGCTIEANEFTALADKFAALNTVVLGVSKDSCESHRLFIEKYKLRVSLVADTGGQLCESYGVWQEKEKKGVKKMGIVRSTFIIDKSGQLLDVEYGVKPEGHAQAVIDKIKAVAG